MVDGSRAKARELDRRYGRLVYWLAAIVVIEPLLLLPVIVVAVRQPALVWLPLVPYAAFTELWLIILIRYMRRSGVTLIAGPVVPGVARFLLGLVGVTGLAALTAVLAPDLAWLWLALYLLAVLALAIWFMRWQVSHLALRCDACGTVFRAGAVTWALSVNIGDYKRVRCPSCRAHWTRVVSADQLLSRGG